MLEIKQRRKPMKKILILMVLLFTTKTLSAGLYGRIEIGKPINSEYFTQEGAYTTETVKYDNIYYTALFLGYKKYLVGDLLGKIYTSTHTISRNNYSNFKGAPFEDIYSMGTSFHFKGFFVKLEHFCAHPVVHDHSFEADQGAWSGQATLFSAGYEFEIN
jgi:hypothetical protein